MSSADNNVAQAAEPARVTSAHQRSHANQHLTNSAPAACAMGGEFAGCGFAGRGGWAGIRRAGSAACATWGALYPFEPRSFVTAGGARMSYLDEGGGTANRDEAVLLLHGNPTWSFFYRDVVRALAPAMRCIAPDHVGMGLSEKPGARDYDYSLATRIGDVEALVASLGLKRVHLVVHDWGGIIGFGFATRHPEMIGRIVILNTAAFPDENIPARIALCRAPLGIGSLIVRGFNGFAWPATWMAMHRRRLSRDEKRGYLFPYDCWRNRIAVREFVRDIPMSASHRSYATLAEIGGKLSLLAAHPKLILWGGRDFCFNDHFFNRWREIYPDAAAHYFPDVGHYILDDGGDEVREKIIGFFGEGKSSLFPV